MILMRSDKFYFLIAESDTPDFRKKGGTEMYKEVQKVCKKPQQIKDIFIIIFFLGCAFICTLTFLYKKKENRIPEHFRLPVLDGWACFRVAFFLAGFAFYMCDIIVIMLTIFYCCTTVVCVSLQALCDMTVLYYSILSFSVILRNELYASTFFFFFLMFGSI